MKIELWHDDSVVARLEVPPSKVMPVVEFKGQFYVRKGNSQEWQRTVGCLRVPPALTLGVIGDPAPDVKTSDFVQGSSAGSLFEGTVLGCEGGRLQVYCTDGVTRMVGN